MARLLLIALGLWALCTFAATAQARRCYHDGLETKDVPTLNVEYPAHVQKRANRQPMRFHTVIDDTDTALSAEQWEYVRQITPLATSYISNMLKVTPATAPIGIQPTCTSTYTVSGKCAEIDPSITCGKSTVPQELIFSIPVCPNDPDTCTNQPAQSGQGVNADFILFVNAKKGGCGASTLAFASHCGKDQNDRPISGFFTICPSVFPEGWTKATSSPTFLATTLSTFVHEVAHALGFSSSLFNYFRDENGNPRVPRDARGRPQQDTAGAVRKVSTERGHTVTKIVTPAVVKVARELSGCPTLDGAELEDGGGSGTAGSHWEERQWWGEFMNGQDTAIRFAYSKLTLALFQDSGWYDVDLESGQTVLWNYGAGCESISGNCLQGDKLNPTSTNRFQWCTTPGQALCSPDRLSTARCSISTFTKDLPAFYQYFSDPKRGGGSSAHDYCPKLSTSYDPANGYDCLGPVSTTPSASDFSMKSLQSRCIIGDLTGPGYVYNGEVTARCYPLTCVRDANGEPTSVNIKLGDKSVTCTKEGDSVTLEGSQGTLICPPLKQVCPFNADCPNSCNGFGTCEKDGKCNCWAGFSGTDCSVYKANKKREAHVSEYMAMLAEQMAVQATPEEDFSRAFADELATASFKYDAAAPGCKAIVTGWLANFPITYSESDPYEVVFRKMIGLVKTLMTTYTDSKTTRCFGPADTRPSVFDSPYDPPSMDPILRPMFVAVSATPVSAADLGKAVGKLALLKGSVLLRQNEVPTRVAPTVTVPAQWTCEQSSYGSLDGCDCDCGAPDPDCDVMTEKSDLYNCGQGSSPKCVAGECTYSTAPAGWTCDPNFYDAGDGCDCGCGVQDPDCSNDLAPVLNCEAGDNPKCVAGQCKYNRVIPKGWVCADSYYDNNDGCHCDCGVWDPDCDKPKIGLLTNCPCPSMKCVKADDPNVSPACQGTCRNTVYQAKSATVPTISSAVKTPGVAATRNNDITQLSFNFAAPLNKV